MNPNRNIYFDFVKGFAILCVIGIHTFIPEKNVSSLSIRQLLNCAVPIFFACSGYFLANKEFKAKGSSLLFYRHQILKIYIPCLIWSFPYLLLAMRNGQSLLQSFLYFFLGGFSIYYFVLAIIQMYFYLPIYRDLNRGWYILITVISTLLICYPAHMSIYSPPLIVDGGIALLWIFFFDLGRKIRRSRRDYSLTLPVIMTLLGFLLSVIESSYFVDTYNNGYGANKLSSYIYIHLE